MKRISSQEALEIIKNMGIAYVIEADSLNYLIEDEEEVECWISDDMLITLNPSNGVTYVTVLPLCMTFSIDELISLIKEKSQKISMLINIQALSKEFIEVLNEKLESEFVYERTLVDYMYKDEMTLEQSETIRMLSSEDKDIFVACSQEQIKNRPPLAVLFDVFVNRHQGQILAAFDQDKIVGYLSFNTIASGVHDVDYIYVIPEMRGQGLGKKLASAYVLYAQSHDYRAYWSNAKNEASEKTAMSCGFGIIRQAKKFVSKQA